MPYRAGQEPAIIWAGRVVYFPIRNHSFPRNATRPNIYIQSLIRGDRISPHLSHICYYI